MQWPNGEHTELQIERSGLELRPGHCVVFLGKTLYSHSASLHPGVYKWVPANCQGNLTKFWEVTCNGLASHPGGVAILLGCGKRDKAPAVMGHLARKTLPFSVVFSLL